ncbi:hypothetical protein P43SY_002806 [Pythium insidiosum]|uniref:RING-type E3 ubiquitin transferase n=1 Tax=Pythium insidiosum TaxID=114742 RepID=A0AAD5QCJ7_PYTIN|nr:hypothetical protein P43SY_002806 [Pythium insidiosum]
MTGLSAAPRNPYVFTREEYDSLVSKMPHPVISARSEYEEVELVEDCTLYDIYRQPRQPVTSPEVTRTLPVRVLNADLTCPICLGIIRNTEVVMECLHRFCGDCIQKCLRVGKNECPSCRIHIPSKRSLRKDTNFDELIAKIYPNLDEFQSQEEKLIEEINRTRHFNNALTQSTKMEESGDMPKLEKTLFRTSYKLKIRHLKKHLCTLLRLENAENMRIVLPAKNCSISGLSTATSAASGGVSIRKDLLFDQELEDYVSLYDIYQQYGMGIKWELQLLYHFSDTIVNGVAQFIANGV